MKNLFKNNASVIASQIFMLVVAIVLTFCISFEGFGKTPVKKAPAFTFDKSYTIEMDREEELEILEEVMSSGVEKAVETPATVNVYSISGKLLYRTSGTQLELMQNQKLNQLLDNSDLMMEMANEYFYLRK